MNPIYTDADGYQHWSGIYKGIRIEACRLPDGKQWNGHVMLHTGVVSLYYADIEGLRADARAVIDEYLAKQLGARRRTVREGEWIDDKTNRAYLRGGNQRA